MATLILNVGDNVDDFTHCTNIMDVVIYNRGHTTELLKGPFKNYQPKTSNHYVRLEEFIDAMDLWDRFEEFSDDYNEL